MANHGVAAALSSSRRPKKFENEKIFICLKIAELDMGGHFWIEENESGHKSSFFQSLIHFRGVNIRIL